MNITQQLLLPIDFCHFKECTEPVVGSSIVASEKHVCKRHNELEWARALAKGKDGYWRTFAKQWLEEMNR